ncbi:MAG TPA: hypothetical protein VIJ34_10575 [Acidimicrobiales bacterium]
MDESTPRSLSIAKSPVTVLKVSLQKDIEAEIAAGNRANRQRRDKVALHRA